MNSPVQEILQLPIEDRRTALWEILSSFPDKAGLFETQLSVDEYDDSLLELLSQRMRKIEGGQEDLISSNAFEALVKSRYGI